MQFACARWPGCEAIWSHQSRPRTRSSFQCPNPSLLCLVFWKTPRNSVQVNLGAIRIMEAWCNIRKLRKLYWLGIKDQIFTRRKNSGPLLRDYGARLVNESKKSLIVNIRYLCHSLVDDTRGSKKQKCGSPRAGKCPSIDHWGGTEVAEAGNVNLSRRQCLQCGWVKVILRSATAEETMHR